MRESAKHDCMCHPFVPQIKIPEIMAMGIEMLSITEKDGWVTFKCRVQPIEKQ